MTTGQETPETPLASESSPWKLSPRRLSFPTNTKRDGRRSNGGNDLCLELPSPKIYEEVEDTECVARVTRVERNTPEYHIRSGRGQARRVAPRNPPSRPLFGEQLRQENAGAADNLNLSGVKKASPISTSKSRDTPLGMSYMSENDSGDLRSINDSSISSGLPSPFLGKEPARTAAVKVSNVPMVGLYSSSRRKAIYQNELGIKRAGRLHTAQPRLYR
eukprot:CAMPEP_0198728040 /NCGR_PEP_ID=MMETSP1475-20131203/6694_1 /TAXON_ID= ORGANISM="Unidentified sp., Strain CCMP1999" /NCGR_SAMPLE_ID=MMETSP1475 /ASSEMBLY_ACC=CAM_ASM_001111 /LENGTH=217 /DNA_ID=CAMNT_0044490285 /DNA_START=149 /DNA_END=802 /DNA_ORIENTATION=-